MSAENFATSESVPPYPGSSPIAARRYTTTDASTNPNATPNRAETIRVNFDILRPSFRHTQYATNGTAMRKFTHQGRAKNSNSSIDIATKDFSFSKQNR